MRFVIFSAGFNSESYVKSHFESVQNQSYKNYIHIIVDDATTDKTSLLVNQYKDNKTIVYKNKTNLGWLHNSVKYLTPNVSDEDVIVLVDLDDWLAHDRVLEFINNIYKNENCWITYGVFKQSDGKVYSKGGYSSHILNRRAFRKTGWRFVHLHTFKAFLWKAINKNDLLGPDKEYARYAYDIAIAYPLLEMTPPDKLRFINQILYIYNVDNRYNDFKVHRRQQKKLKNWFKSKPSYSILNRIE